MRENSSLSDTDVSGPFSTILKQLHRLATIDHTDVDLLFADYLHTGCELFDLPTGIISRIDGDSYLVQAVRSPLGIQAGQVFALQETYCHSVLAAGKTIAYAHVAKLPDLLGHPAYLSLKLESYISAPIFVRGEIYGTINFSANEPRIDGFSKEEQEVIELMAQGIGRLLALQQAEHERQQVEQELRQREQTLRDLLEAASIGVIMVNQEGQIALVNRELEKAFGYNREQILGSQVEQLLPSRLNQNHQQHRRDFMATPITRPMGIGMNLVGRRRDGSEFPVEVSLSSTEIDGETVALAFVADITHRKEAEDKDKMKTRALAQSNSELEQYAYVISHDLRAPLRVMNQYSLFLKEDIGDKLDADSLEYLGGIIDNAQHMEEMVIGLLEYGKVGQGDLPKQKVAVKTLLQRVIARLPLAQQAQVILPAENLEIFANPLRLEQIFANLIQNGLKFHAPDVTANLRILIDENPKEWQIDFVDNGIGIEAERIPQLFGIFRRLHSREVYAGTGIGLAIVKKAVSESGGRIEVSSVPDQGSTFTVILPK